MDQISPLPWHIERTRERRAAVVAANGAVVVSDLREVDARLIVESANWRMEAERVVYRFDVAGTAEDLREGL